MPIDNNNLYGFPRPTSHVFPAPIVAQRAPLTTDFHYPIGQVWIDEANGTNYTLVSVVANVATWNLGGVIGGPVDTLTGNSGGAIGPSGGNINLLGAASQIVATGSGSTITFGLPAAVIAPGSVTVTSGFTVSAGTSSLTGTVNVNTSGAGVTSINTGGTGATNIGNATGNTAVTGSLTASTSLTATAGAITATNGNLVLGSAGNKLVIHATTAANDSVGLTAAMSGTPGSITVTTSACTVNSKVFVQRATTGGTLGNISVPTATIGAGSFVINSDANETSTFMYVIIN